MFHFCFSRGFGVVEFEKKSFNFTEVLNLKIQSYFLKNVENYLSIENPFKQNSIKQILSLVLSTEPFNIKKYSHQEDSHGRAGNSM